MKIRELWINLLYLSILTHAIEGNIPRIEPAGIGFNDNVHNTRQIGISEETERNRWHGVGAHQQINKEENNLEAGNFPVNSLVHTNSASSGESGFVNNQQNQNEGWHERHVQGNEPPTVRPTGRSSNEQKDFAEAHQHSLEDTNAFKDVMKDIHITEWNPAQEGIELVVHEIKDSGWNKARENALLTDLVNSNIKSEWNNHQSEESLPFVGINEERDARNEQFEAEGLRNTDFKHDEQRYVEDQRNRQPSTNDQDRGNQIKEDRWNINSDGRENFHTPNHGLVEEKNLENDRQTTQESWNIGEDSKTTNAEQQQDNFSDRRHDSVEMRSPGGNVPNTRDSWFTSNEFKKERGWVKDHSFHQNEETWEGKGEENKHDYDANTQKTDLNWDTNSEQIKDRGPIEFPIDRGLNKPQNEGSRNFDENYNINDQINDGKNVFIEFTQSSPGQIDENGILHIDMSSLQPLDGHFQTTDNTATRLLEENLDRGIISSLTGQLGQPGSAGGNVFSVNEFKLTRGDAAITDQNFNTQTPQGNNKGGYDSSYTGNNYGESSHENSIPGVVGQDYPNYSSLPVTGFDCRKQNIPGYFADMEAGCQVYHICQSDGRHNSFLCPTGTIFNQKLFTCDWWYNYDCSSSSEYYSLNFMLYRESDAQGNYKGSYYSRNTVGSVFPSQVPPTSNIPIENLNKVNREERPVNEYEQREENSNANLPFKENNFGYRVNEGNSINNRGDSSYFPTEEVNNSWIDLNNAQEANAPRNERLDDTHFYHTGNSKEGFDSWSKNNGIHQNTEEVNGNNNPNVWLPNEPLSQVNERNIGINYGESNDNFWSTKRKDDDIINNKNEKNWDPESKLTKESEINEKNKVYNNNNHVPMIDAHYDNKPTGGYTKSQNGEKSAKERGNEWRDYGNEKPTPDLSRSDESTEPPWQSGESYNDFQNQGRNSGFFKEGRLDGDENSSNKNHEEILVERPVHGENKNGREMYKSDSHRTWEEQNSYEADGRSGVTTKEDIDKRRNEPHLAQGNDDRTVDSVYTVNAYRIPVIRNEERAVFEENNTRDKPDLADRQRINADGESIFVGNINDFVQDGPYFILMGSDGNGFSPEMLDTANGGMTLILQNDENSHKHGENENAPMSVIPNKQENEKTMFEVNEGTTSFNEDQKVGEKDSRNFPKRDEFLGGRRDPRARENNFKEGTSGTGGGQKEPGFLQTREDHPIIDKINEKPSELGFIPTDDSHWKTTDEKITHLTGHEETPHRRYEDPYFRRHDGWEKHHVRDDKYLSENYGQQEGSEVHHVNVSLKAMEAKQQPIYVLNEEKIVNEESLLTDGWQKEGGLEKNSNKFDVNFVTPELELKTDETETSPKINNSFIIKNIEEEEKKSFAENITDRSSYDTIETQNINSTNPNLPFHTNEKKKVVKYIDFSRDLSGDLKTKNGGNKNYDNVTELDTFMRNKGVKRLSTAVGLSNVTLSEEGKIVKSRFNRFDVTKNVQYPKIKIVRKRKNGQIVPFASISERPTA